MTNSQEDENFVRKIGLAFTAHAPESFGGPPHPGCSSSASFYRKLLAFAGPGFLVAVGYMDPGNWATDLAGGSKFNYALLSVIMISNFMAILLQSLSLKLGSLPDATSPRPAATITANPSPFAFGSYANWPSRRATSPKSSARRSHLICFLAFPSSGEFASPRSMCW